MIIFIIVLVIIVVIFILMVMGGLESYDPKSDNKGFVSNNNSDSTTKDEFPKNKKDYFEPARVEVKMVQRIGNENSSYIYYE